MKKRIAFFAHFDPDGRIDDYVIYYIKGLFDSGIEKVYFSSDSNMISGEENKLPQGTIVVNTTRHGEYDFGSWKRCMLAFDVRHGNFSEIDELILCNDSCYGPLCSLEPMFKAMQRQDCDFWGITQVEYLEGYTPSFFLVIRQQVLADCVFTDFLKNVEKFTDKYSYCLTYEVGICRLLEGKRYKRGCYLADYSHLCHSSSKALSTEVFDQGMPFIRVLTLRSNPGGIPRLGEKVAAVCRRFNYPIQYILNHLKRTSPSYKKFWLYRFGDIDKKLLGFINIRQKPNPQKDTLRIKIKLWNIPVFYCVFPMLYCKDDMANNNNGK